MRGRDAPSGCARSSRVCYFGGVGASLTMFGHERINSGAHASTASPQCPSPPLHRQVSKQQDQHENPGTPFKQTIRLHSVSHHFSASPVLVGDEVNSTSAIGAITRIQPIRSV